MTKNFDCYKCNYRGRIPGDAHSMCNHPKVEQDSNVFGALVDMLGSKNEVARQELNIQGHPVGIRSGCFLWPTNFDPVWLQNCDGFLAKGGD